MADDQSENLAGESERGNEATLENNSTALYGQEDVDMFNLADAWESYESLQFIREATRLTQMPQETQRRVWKEYKSFQAEFDSLPPEMRPSHAQRIQKMKELVDEAVKDAPPVTSLAEAEIPQTRPKPNPLIALGVLWLLPGAAVLLAGSYKFALPFLVVGVVCGLLSGLSLKDTGGAVLVAFSVVAGTIALVLVALAIINIPAVENSLPVLAILMLLGIGYGVGRSVKS